MKVKIIKQVGQTGLLKPDTIVDRPQAIAEKWIDFGWAKSLRKKRKPKKDVQDTK